MRLQSTATQPTKPATMPVRTATVEWPQPDEDELPPTEATPRPTPAPTPDAPFAMSVLAHELRAPLSSLSAASELLLDDLNVLEPRQMRDMLQTIRDGTLWLQGLVENLVCAASIQAGRFRVQAEPLSLLDVVMDVQSIVMPLLLQKGQTLKLAATSNLPLVLADRRWTGQAIVNLVSNASKYSPANTPISVRISQRGGYIRTAVADRGPGLPVGGEGQLFEPYYRGTEAVAADAGGMGLGLAIVKAVVDSHGGRVGAENRSKGGACLWFELATEAGH
jgi:two-component system, OmpR family, sensor histidine kinase KdpD